MELFNLKCPQCDADLEVTDEYDMYQCPYCNCKFILEGRSDTAAKVKIHKDDMEYKKYKLEHNSIEKDKEFSRELKRNKETRKEKMIPLFVLGGLLLLVVSFYIGSVLIDIHKDHVLENEAVLIRELIAENQFDEAETKIKELKYEGENYDLKQKWNEIQQNLIREVNRAKSENEESIPIRINISSKKIRKMQYEDVVAYFEELGFYNISAIESAKRRLLIHKIGEVDTISIDGITAFDETAEFLKSAVIVISYYGL